MRTNAILTGQQPYHCPRGLRRRAGAAPAPGRVLVAQTALAPSAILVLLRLEPRDGALNPGLAWADANRVQTGKRRTGAVEIVDAPASPPRAVVFLLAFEPLDGAARDRVVGAVADHRHHLEHAAGEVGAGRVRG